MIDRITKINSQNIEIEFNNIRKKFNRITKN